MAQIEQLLEKLLQQNQKTWFTLQDASLYLSLSERELRRLIKLGRIKSVRVSEGPKAQYRIARKWMDCFLLGYNNPSRLTPGQREELNNLDYRSV